MRLARQGQRAVAPLMALLGQREEAIGFRDVQAGA